MFHELAHPSGRAHPEVARLARRARKTALCRKLIRRDGELLALSDEVICQVAGLRGGGNLAWIVLQQFWYEQTLRFWKHVSFRRRQNDDACRAYCTMTWREFQGINARQRWANWRTIPRNLNGRLSNQPVRVVDLCCGTGDSTEVLAFYAAPGSEFIGLEFNQDFVALARRRAFTDENNRSCHVVFNTQSVLETFRRPSGDALLDGGTDVVNCCGAVGCHFDTPATAKLMDEVVRVLRDGGLALIDSSPHGTSTGELIELGVERGLEVLGHAKSCTLDRFKQVCFRKR